MHREAVMGVPDYQELMLPVLKATADGAEHRVRDLTARMADEFSLSAEDREQIIPSGSQTTISNRVHWAKTYLTAAGLLESAGWGKTRITDEGRRVLAENPPRIDNDLLARYESFRAFKGKKPPAADTTPVESRSESDDETPDEAIDHAYRTLREGLIEELLERVKACSPTFFEQLVVRLLVAMGYGGTLADAGESIGRTGDEGIDGRIKEDRLGLDFLCVQAKRWEGTVGRPMVQAFAGSMEGQRARKGVMLTTSAFSKEAHDFVTKIERRIVLIDGRQLAELMIDHGLGVSPVETYEIKRVDNDFFPEATDG